MPPARHRAFSDRGLEKTKTGDLEGALASFTAAIRGGAWSFDAFESRGKTLLRLNRAVEAEADFDVAISLAPDLSTGYERRASARMARGDFQGALADCDEALRLKPTSIKHFQRAAVRKQLGDFEGALADYDDALGLDSRNAGDHVARGELRAAGGDLEGAVADYEQALRLDPQHAAAYAHRAVAREAHGDVSGAATDYEKALRLCPELASARHRLERLRRAAVPVQVLSLTPRVVEKGEDCNDQVCSASSTCSTRSSEGAAVPEERYLPQIFSWLNFEACKTCRPEPEELTTVRVSFPLDSTLLPGLAVDTQDDGEPLDERHDNDEGPPSADKDDAVEPRMFRGAGNWQPKSSEPATPALVSLAVLELENHE